MSILVGWRTQRAVFPPVLSGLEADGQQWWHLSKYLWLWMVRIQVSQPYHPQPDVLHSMSHPWLQTFRFQHVHVGGFSVAVTFRWCLVWISLSTGDFRRIISNVSAVVFSANLSQSVIARALVSRFEGLFSGGVIIPVPVQTSNQLLMHI